MTREDIVKVDIIVGATVNSQWTEFKDHPLYGRQMLMKRGDLVDSTWGDIHVKINNCRYRIGGRAGYTISLIPDESKEVSVEII